MECLLPGKTTSIVFHALSGMKFIRKSYVVELGNQESMTEDQLFLPRTVFLPERKVEEVENPGTTDYSKKSTPSLP